MFHQGQSGMFIQFWRVLYTNAVSVALFVNLLIIVLDTKIIVLDMAQDLTVYEFCTLTSTEELATDFARQHRLLVSNQHLQTNNSSNNNNNNASLGLQAELVQFTK
jgi:hypothetical protein